MPMKIVMLGLLFFISYTPLQARSLYWEDMDVKARLRADGSLHVIERQHYVFNGNWNGGERRFNIGWGEQLQLLRLSRIDPVTQQGIALHEGDLSRVDSYKLKDKKILRWRSRLPQAPLFRNQHLIYELEYVYSGILNYDDGVYRLNHNFAFRDRPGEFRHYHLDLAIDPVWQVMTVPFETMVDEQHLPPGSGVVLQARLNFQGKGRPTAVAMPLPLAWRQAMLAALFLFVAVYLVLWLRHERRQGRFAALVPVEEIDEDWLKAYVFSELPEQVGSLWDLDTGAAEVSALLARLTLEQKLKSHIEIKGFWIFKKPVLHLELLVNADQLTTMERRVINKLFPRGMKTDTDFIREYYRKKGFDPASYIRSRLKGHKLKKKYESAKGRSRKVTLIAYAAALVCTGIGLLLGNSDDLAFVIPGAFVAVLGIVFFLFKVAALQIEVESPRWRLFRTVFWYLLLVSAVSVFVLSGIGSPSIWFLLAHILILAGLFAYILDSSRTNLNIKYVQLRKRLCAARRFFQEELRKPEPKLRDEWYPYLIAFGLDAAMQKWFRAFGGRVRQASSHGLANTSMTTSSSSWTGGGGSFGGAGASGAWTAAAATMSAGFSAPSSSSSGGGGGGGGSSGGGGGGGW